MDNVQEVFANWDKAIFTDGWLYTVIVSAVAVIAAIILTRTLTGIFKRRAAGNMMFVCRLINALIVLIAALSVLMTISPFKKLAETVVTTSGIAAIVLGLAAQETLGNLFSGIAIGFGKPFEIGEYVEIASMNVMGTVESINLRHTVIAGADGKRAVVPNSLINKELLRTTKMRDNRVCSSLDISVSYNADLDRAESIIKEAISEHPEALDIRTDEQKAAGEPAVTTRIEDFGESAILIKAFVWTNDGLTGKRVLSDVRRRVKREFDKNGIEIPYPYRNVIIKKEA